MSGSDAWREHQAESLATATRRYEPWTARDDEVVSSALSLDEMARQDGRTYAQVSNRRSTLGVTSLGPGGARVAGSERPAAPALCPCASLDGDHEPWCPA